MTSANEPVRDEPSSLASVSGSTISFRSGRVIDIRTDDVAMPGQPSAKRDIVVHPGAVGIIALDADQRVLLIQQYRHPVRRLLWEAPAGLLDIAGEDPLVAAKRELFEEAHMRADRWDVLIDLFPSAGGTDEAVRVYLARDLSAATEPRWVGQHEEADMPVRWVPLAEAVTGVLAAYVAAHEAFATLRPAAAPWPEMSSFIGSQADTPQP
jgi:8-oxo-dGDP phosphatase